MKYVTAQGTVLEVVWNDDHQCLEAKVAEDPGGPSAFVLAIKAPTAAQEAMPAKERKDRLAMYTKLGRSPVGYWGPLRESGKRSGYVAKGHESCITVTADQVMTGMVLVTRKGSGDPWGLGEPDIKAHLTELYEEPVAEIASTTSAQW